MKAARLVSEKERNEVARNIKKKINKFSGGVCKTPGLKIRSKGRGRGLARGKGRGPLGLPFGYK